MEEEELWEAFSIANLDWFFPQELREAKIEEFVNLRKGRMLVKKYALKFHQLSRYALDFLVFLLGVHQGCLCIRRMVTFGCALTIDI